MIKSFNHKGLKLFAAKGDTSKLPVQNIDRLTRQVAALDVATAATDMDVPGWKFHELKGDRKGTYSVSTSGNWRLTWIMEGTDAADADLEDYH